jgi:putative transposase
MCCNVGFELLYPTLMSGEVKRKITYRLYPSKRQEEAMRLLFDAHRHLYNAALEQRIWAYRSQKKSIDFKEQCRELTQLRAEDPLYRSINAQSSQVTLRRLHLAFQHFFRRVRQNKKAGFPRFRSAARFKGWGYKTHGDGWRLFPGEEMKHGHLRLSGVGNIKLRGRARSEGTPKTMEIIRDHGRWYASVTIACAPMRKSGTQEIGFDWGLESFLTFDEGGVVVNPRHLSQSQSKISHLQRQKSKKKRGGSNRKKVVLQLAREYRRSSNRRKPVLNVAHARRRSSRSECIGVRVGASCREIRRQLRFVWLTQESRLGTCLVGRFLRWEDLGTTKLLSEQHSCLTGVVHPGDLKSTYSAV